MQKSSLECFPDIETASVDYEKRFSGEIGKFFLNRQAELVSEFLPEELPSLKILEVGGGHCQLSRYFLEKGHQVWIHGSDEMALWKARELGKNYPGQVHATVSPFLSLGFENGSFDVVVSIRLLSHFEDWKMLIAELCRVSRNEVIIDFPPKSSFNILYPLLFGLKKKMEGDTRTFYSFDENEIRNEFLKNGFTTCKSKAQFFFPMVIHRCLKSLKISKCLEHIASTLGLTKLFGSPLIFLAQKEKNYSAD